MIKICGKSSLIDILFKSTLLDLVFVGSLGENFFNFSRLLLLILCVLCANLVIIYRIVLGPIRN